MKTWNRGDYENGVLVWKQLAYNTATPLLWSVSSGHIVIGALFVYSALFDQTRSMSAGHC